MREWRVLEKSEEKEYLVDAVENLWEKVLCKAGEMCGEYMLAVREWRVGLMV